MSKDKIDIVVTDDHLLFRKGMSALLEDFDFVDEIYEAGNGVELLQLVKGLKEKPDVVLLDIRMPEMDGIEATKKIRKLYPELKIIILSMEDDAQIVSMLIREGINGYLLKNADPDELELAIKKVVRNDYYFSGSLSNLVIKTASSNEEERELIESLQLTERELKILTLICQEFTASEIADKLMMSVRTIEGHRRKLLEKTGSKNLAGLVVFALKNGLVEV